MEEPNKFDKKTEFDSSVATLQRINALMIRLHECELGLLSEQIKNNTSFRVKILNRLYVEAHVKFNPKEKIECEKHLNKINNKRVELSSALTSSKIMTSFDTTRPNKKYYGAWSKINLLAGDFELFMVKCLDNHNLLMKDSQSGMGKFRS